MAHDTHQSNHDGTGGDEGRDDRRRRQAGTGDREMTRAIEWWALAATVVDALVTAIELAVQMS